MTESKISKPKVEITHLTQSHHSNIFRDLSNMDGNNDKNDPLILLELAKKYVEREDFSNAVICLKKALNKTREVHLKSIINIRLARIQLHQKDFESTLKTLDCVKELGWSSLVDEIKGDVQFNKGDQQAARFYYEKALQSYAPQSFVRLKIYNLPSS